ncbi:MAG: hypothetical protein WAT52_07660 [Chitinophagales bacterium]
MNKIKFKIVYQEPDDTTVNSHKNFDGLMAMYSATTSMNWFQKLLQNKWFTFLGGIILGTAITALLVSDIFNTFNSTTPSNNISKNSPIEEATEIKNNNTNIQKNVIVTDTIKKENTEVAYTEITESKNKQPKIAGKQHLNQYNRSSNPVSVSKRELNVQSQNIIVEENALENNETKEVTTVSEFEIALTETVAEIATENLDKEIIDNNSEKKQSVSGKEKNEKQQEKADMPISDNSKQKNQTTKIEKQKPTKDTIILIDKIFNNNSLSKNNTNNDLQNAELQKLDENQTTDTLIHRAVQVSFITPLSTNGYDGTDFVHKFSFNILQGYSGALNGIEIGGLVNMDKQYVHGFQLAGLSNLTQGDIKGCQISGIYNHGNSMQGFQLAGLINSTRKSGTGFQTAGILNLTGNTFNGFQLAGISNITMGAADTISNWQLSGILNISNKHNGGQLGLINLSKKIDGVQIGLLNFSDTLNGVAIGLISYSNNGILETEIFNSELFTMSAGIRIGTKHIFNTIAFGISPFNNSTLYGFGFGIGGRIPFNPSVILDIDAIAWTPFENTIEFSRNNFRIYNQLRLLPAYTFIASGFSVFAGPVFNVEVYENDYTPITKNDITTYYGSDYNTALSIGYTAGVRYNFKYKKQE